MIRTLKNAALLGLRGAGVYALALRSRWRRERVAILCYHGVSIADEHLWDGALYMRPAMFERRLEILRDGGYNVLTLSEATRRLYEGTLPPRSVCLTFDDGAVDFVVRAQPLLERFGFPATVYLTTYYSDLGQPVFNTLVRYIFWKADTDHVDAKPITGVDEQWPVTTRWERAAALRKLLAYCEEEDLSGRDKAELAERIARDLGVDYDRILELRLFQIMTPAEAATMVEKGIDIQLHTHRHLSPEDRETFLREIEDNRARIHSAVGYDPTHFCYPMAVCRPEYPGWLKETHVETATITTMAMASRSDDRHEIPRIVDVERMSELEFEAFLTGARFLIPRRGSLG